MPQIARDREAAAAGARRVLATLARQDANTFMEYVLRDEQTGASVVQAVHHVEWHRLLDRHARLVLHAFVESGKTANLTTGRVLWELGRDPTLRVAVVSNTHDQATKIVRTIGGYVRQSPELHAVFPGLRPGQPWRDEAMTVQRRTQSKDASVRAYGLHGPVLGSRIDLLVLDDVLDFEGTRTESQRETTWQWVRSTLLGRLTERGRVVAVGTAWHPDDLMHRLARETGWHAARYPVLADDGMPRWPERWSPERVEARRQELGPFESARQLDCVARADESAVFRDEWIKAALANGAGTHLAAGLHGVPAGARVVVGVDLGISLKRTADLTAITAVLVRPDGRRVLLGIEAGRWAIDEIAARIERAHHRYLAQTVVVESVAAQQLIADLLRRTRNVPAVGFKTGAGKMSLPYQAELLGAELAAGRWALPSGDGRLAPEVRALVGELLAYSPADHCGDRLSALLMARWGAELGDRKIQVFRLDMFSR